MWNFFSTDYTPRTNFLGHRNTRERSTQTQTCGEASLLICCENNGYHLPKYFKVQIHFPLISCFSFCTMTFNCKWEKFTNVLSKEGKLFRCWVWRYLGQGCWVLRVPDWEIRGLEDASVYFWCILWVCFMLSIKLVTSTDFLKRIHLLMQGTWVPTLLGKLHPTFLQAAEPTHHQHCTGDASRAPCTTINYWSGVSPVDTVPAAGDCSHLKHPQGELPLLA